MHIYTWHQWKIKVQLWTTSKQFVDNDSCEWTWANNLKDIGNLKDLEKNTTINNFKHQQTYNCEWETWKIWKKKITLNKLKQTIVISDQLEKSITYFLNQNIEHAQTFAKWKQVVVHKQP
jgi:hypothetical protein